LTPIPEPSVIILVFIISTGATILIWRYKYITETRCT
jgi:hypothetical protein